MLKRNLKSAKASKALAEHTLKGLRAEAKHGEKKLKLSIKNMKKCEKDLKKLWYGDKEKIELVKQFKCNKDEIETIYGKEGKKAIKACIKEMQQTGEMPLNLKAEDLNKEIKKALKSEERPKTSLLKDIIEQNEKVVETEKQEESDIKKSIKEGIIFGKETTIDKKKIEALQRKMKNPTYKQLSAEEFMTYIGFTQYKKRINEECSYEEFLKEINENGKNEKKTMYAKQAIKSLEKMIKDIDGKEEIDVENMDFANELMYKIAKQYKSVKVKDAKNKDKQEELEVG